MKLSERIAEARPGEITTATLRQWVLEADELETECHEMRWRLNDTQQRLEAHRSGRVFRAIQVPVLSREQLLEMAKQTTPTRTETEASTGKSSPGDVGHGGDLTQELVD